MRITVFGIGYVGLVQAAVLSEVGHDVCCVDCDEDKIKQLQLGYIPIFEPGLAALVQANHAAGRLQFTTDAAAGVAFGDILFIAVGTPSHSDGSANLSYVKTVAATIASTMQTGKIVVDKSTVPVGTAERLSQIIAQQLKQRQSTLPFEVISNPEFLKEGAAVSDCMRPDRIIIGLRDELAKDNMTITNDPLQVRATMRELYAPFNRNHDKIVFMDAKSAELTKYAANCMLATKISFMNEIANIAERVGANVESVRQGIGSDERIGYHFIYAGCGYGGSCFPKDVTALIHSAKQMNYQAELLTAVANVNDRQKLKLSEYIAQHYECEASALHKPLAGKVFALWGLSFKPKTDDMREAPSRCLLQALWDAGAKVQAYDPEAMDEAQRLYGLRDDFILVGTKEAALKNADALVVCTEWQNFKAPDFGLIEHELADAVIFDGRNLYDPERVAQYGLTYWSIGRPMVSAGIRLMSAKNNIAASELAVSA